MQPNPGIEEVTAREREYLDLLQRTRADFINYKRRVEQEQDERSKFAKADLIVKLLPVLDDFRRAQEAMSPEIADAEWVKGIEIIKRNLMAVLEEEGVSRINAEGEDFDPREHEAVSYEESDEYEEGKVKAIYNDGYRLNGMIIRPAQVAVSRGGEKSRNINRVTRVRKQQRRK